MAVRAKPAERRQDQLREGGQEDPKHSDLLPKQVLFCNPTKEARVTSGGLSHHPYTMLRAGKEGFRCSVLSWGLGANNWYRILFLFCSMSFDIHCINFLSFLLFIVYWLSIHSPLRNKSTVPKFRTLDPSFLNLALLLTSCAILDDSHKFSIHKFPC